MPKTPWNEDLYVDYYLDLMNDNYPESQNEREANFIENVLDLFYGDNLLDLCSGTGRHTVSMAKRGYQVAGIDLSSQLIDYSKEQVKSSTVENKVGFYAGDITEISPDQFANSFRAAFCLASFGYHMTDGDLEKTLNNINPLLAPGGFVLIDVKNRERMLRYFNERNWVRTSNGYTCLRQSAFNFEQNRVEHYKYISSPSGDEEVFHQWMRTLTLHELTGLLTRTGFKLEKYYGNFRRAKYSMDSQRMIVVATKNY